MKSSQLAIALAAFGASTLAANAGLDIGLNLNFSGPVIRSSPPPERVEVLPPSPGREFVWVKGHWAWHHEHWEWINGHWERPVQPGMVWIPGQWVAQGGGWVWAEGHYSMQAAPPPPPPQQPERVVAYEPPPSNMIQESVPPAPGPGYIWIQGYWTHHHGGWRWVTGRWDIAPQPGMVWSPAQWVREGDHWVLFEGHFVFQSPPVPPQGQNVEIIANEAPPPVVAEAVPPSPGMDFFWISGHWHWDHRWVWVRGHYERHPHFHPGGGWVAGHWDRRGGSYVWVEGYWR